MIKEQAVATLGQGQLLQPALLRDALYANDRIKLVLSLLQTAAQRCQAPETPPVDLARDIAATDIARYEDVEWLRNVANLADQDGDGMRLPGLDKLRARLKEDLQRMAAPLRARGAPDELEQRLSHWDKHLDSRSDRLSYGQLAALTHARHGRGDSLHLLVMEMHKALNLLAADLSECTVAGAHAWGLAQDGSDVPCIEAFMRGLQRTHEAKLDHPGLGTTATRDADKLLIQNDIGTNDAHVLVMQIQGLGMTLTYSDLHEQRFAFFQRLLQEVGAKWGEAQSRSAAGVNEGKAFHVGIATFSAANQSQLHEQLEGVGARIVFLIDWNRARKQLVAVAGKQLAVTVLEAAARDGCGHMAWLRAGGAQLVWNSMGGQPEADFRLGDRLVDVLSPQGTRDFLLELMQLSRRAAGAQEPVALVSDQARLLLAHYLAGRHRGLTLLQEHAALCQALAQALEDGVRHGALRDAARARKLAARAKEWERAADDLVTRARAQAERQSRWHAFARLLEGADNIADSMEEAVFVLHALADCEAGDWSHDMREAIEALSHRVTEAAKDSVRLLEVASGLEPASIAQEQKDFLDTLWRIQQAEQACDLLHRRFRLAAAHELKNAAALVLANEFSASLEAASDAMLSFAWKLRAHMLGRSQAVAR